MGGAGAGAWQAGLAATAAAAAAAAAPTILASQSGVREGISSGKLPDTDNLSS